MISVDDLTIKQAKELAAQFAAAYAPQGLIDHGLQIVVLDRGFVYIGEFSTDGKWCYIENAWNIRRWGTTRGLGELVNGPTPETQLDQVGRVRVPFHALQHLIAVDDEKWTKYFS